jgi:predicted MFS family arabinose efflux permease
VWFVVGLPVFLYAQLGWGFTQVGSFLALWVIGYGAVQAAAPELLRAGRVGSRIAATQGCTFALAAVPAGMALALGAELDAAPVLMVGLAVFAGVFALDSSLHSYLILAYTERDDVALNVGFYYMANAGGRLTGTVLSGAVYGLWGLPGCLWAALAFVLAAALLSLLLPPEPTAHPAPAA